MTKGKKSKAAFPMSADDVFWWSNWILIGALLVGVAATYAIVVSGNLKEAALKRQLADAGSAAASATERASALEAEAANARERTAALEKESEGARKAIAEANASGEAAKAEAAKANAEIAIAKQQTAALENEAAQARLDQERLKAVVAWRILTPDTINHLAAGLGDPKGTALLGYTANDPEALYLVIQISKAFEAAKGWALGVDARTYPDRLLWGIFIPGDGALVEHVRAAFKAANIPFSTEAIPEPPMRFGPQITADTVLIFIGSKQPPI
jgi:hypothetical protein